MPNSRIILYLLVTLCTGCVQAPGDKPVDAAGFPKGDAKMHAVHSKELLEIMERLNVLVRNREAPVRKPDEWREEYLQNLIDVAGEVVIAAEALAAAGPDEGMDRNEKAVFHTLADRLYVETANIEIQARESNFMELRDAYDRLDHTCNACHRLFRKR